MSGNVQSQDDGTATSNQHLDLNNRGSQDEIAQYHPSQLSNDGSRTVWILYGSETGNAQDVAEELAQLITRHHFQTTVLALDDVQSLRDLLVKPHLVIFVVATAGQGEFPQNARSFWSRLLSAALRPERGPLRRLRYASCGLGDSSYPRFNFAHRALDARLRQLGARPICNRGEGNEQHPEGHAAGVREWIIDSLRPALTTAFPVPEGLDLIPDEAFVEPAWILRQARDESTTPIQGSWSLNAHDALPSPELLPVSGSHAALLVSNERVTTEDHFQDVRLLDLHLRGDIEYHPGAVAVIYPKNFPEDVQRFVELMEWQEIADCPLTLIPSATQPSGRTTVQPSPLRDLDLSSTQLTLRWLLSNVLDIMSIPRRSFFATLARLASAETEDEQYQRTRLLELADPVLIDELWDYTTRPKRTILEVLMDFTTVRIPWRYVLSTIPRMRGRHFSIASGGILKRLPVETGPTESAEVSTQVPHRTRVQLLVAIVDPPSPIIKWRRRYGVCTRYLATLSAGTELAVSILPGARLGAEVANPGVPLVLVGPGTGLAPLRALLHERLAIADHESIVLHADGSSRNGDKRVSRPLATDLLFFGCRAPGKDDFFPLEWPSLCADAGLRRYVAYSRAAKDVSQRQYVQDQIRAQGAAVREALVERNGYLIVCGSAGNMPKGVRSAVEEVLAEAFMTKVGVPKENDAQEAARQASDFLINLEKSGHYKQETW